MHCVTDCILLTFWSRVRFLLRLFVFDCRELLLKALWGMDISGFVTLFTTGGILHSTPV